MMSALTGGGNLGHFKLGIEVVVAKVAVQVWPAIHCPVAGTFVL